MAASFWTRATDSIAPDQNAQRTLIATFRRGWVYRSKEAVTPVSPRTSFQSQYFSSDRL